MKKAGYVIALLLEMAFLAGAYIFNYFTVRKLGMSRYVIFLNHQIEETVPIQAIIYGGLAVMVVLFVIAVFAYWKKREVLRKLPRFMLIVSAGMTAFCAYFTLANNIGEERSYYVLSVCFLGTGLVQVLKTIAGCALCRTDSE